MFGLATIHWRAWLASPKIVLYHAIMGKLSRAPNHWGLNSKLQSKPRNPPAKQKSFLFK